MEEEKEREKLIQVGEMFLVETANDSRFIWDQWNVFVEITNIIYIYGTQSFII